MSYVIAAIPNKEGNDGLSPEQAYRKLHNAGACPSKPFAEMFKFEVPSLMVGTLDTLMQLSDDLVKTDSIVESIVRKIEKTYVEISRQSHAELKIGEVPIARYIQSFAWDYAKYPNRRPLKELVSLIAGGATAIDEELKQLCQSFADKQVALQENQKRKGGNLLTVDLNEILTEDMMRREVYDTEYLKTIFIAVPKSSCETFENDIYNVGANLVGYGGPDWSRDSRNLGQPISFGSNVDRHLKRGSPVVPGSLKEITEDADSALYTVTILKSQYEAGYYEGEEFQAGTTIDFEEEFMKACRDKRYIVRPFEYNPDQAGQSAFQLTQLKTETDGMRSGLTRWSKTHYGEAFVAWMHIKVIRVFVESILRYGLPPDFTAVLYKVADGKNAELIDALDAALGNLDLGGEGEGGDDDDEYHDFVLLKFDLK